jgi:hypothetical protein
MARKIIGYLLLVFGLAIILSAAYYIYGLFTGGFDAPSVFEMKSITLTVPSGQAAGTEVELLDAKAATKFANMGICYILMIFLLSAGSRISSIGVQMLRDIRIVVKESSGAVHFSTKE